MAAPLLWLLEPTQGARDTVIVDTLAAWLAVPADSLALDHAASGRPLLRGADVDISLADCGPLVVLGALPNGRLGVDAEPIDTDLDPARLAADHFTPGEAAWLASLPAETRHEAFLRLWTAKEALLKALGVGLPFGLANVEIAVGADGRLSLAKVLGSAEMAAGWRLAEWRLLTRHGPLRAAVVWTTL
jgi:4'-phosphopantetheinyl transferase